MPFNHWWSLGLEALVPLDGGNNTLVADLLQSASCDLANRISLLRHWAEMVPNLCHLRTVAQRRGAAALIAFPQRVVAR